MKTPTPEELADEAQPIPPKSNAVPRSEIPLPPADLVDQLDNSSVSNETAAEDELEIATLDFFGDDLPVVEFPLKYPFRWEGEPVTSITVRQLTVTEVGQAFARARIEKRVPDLFDFYAAMCGLPAKVLRALPAADGDPIVDKAWDFLPQSVRPEPG